MNLFMLWLLIFQKIYSQLAVCGKAIYGSRFQVELDEQADAQQIKQWCLEKQFVFNDHLVPSMEADDYTLCFRSLRPATYIPGSDVPLTLKKYKEAVSLAYSSIVFVLHCHPVGECL